MDTNELRKGNYIKFQGRVICLDTNEKLFNALQGIDSGDDYEPIQLNQFLLHGMNWELFDNKWSNYGVYLERIKELRCFEFQFDGSCISIEYFHQLQNLYFALIGDEMEVDKKELRVNLMTWI